MSLFHLKKCQFPTMLCCVYHYYWVGILVCIFIPSFKWKSTFTKGQPTSMWSY